MKFAYTESVFYTAFFGHVAMYGNSTIVYPDSCVDKCRRQRPVVYGVGLTKARDDVNIMCMCALSRPLPAG